MTYEDGVRVHQQLIEKRTSKAEDMLEVAQLHNTLGRLEAQIENLTRKMQMDEAQSTSYLAQINRLESDQEVIRQAIEIHNQYIAGFDKR